MKISVSTYSFSRLIQQNRLTQLGCVAQAKKMGFDAIEFADILPHNGSSVQEYAMLLAQECARLNMPVANYTVSADFLNGCGGDLDAEIRRVKEQVDIAALLGAVSMRHDATWGFSPGERSFRGFSDVLPRLAKGCRQVTEYAASKGIKTMVENHGFFCQESYRVEQLVNTVAHDNFGVLADMGNFLCADESPVHALGRLAPYVFYSHAKDFHIKSGMAPDPGQGFFRTRGGNFLRGAIIGHGEVPIVQCLSILKGIGYDGYIGLEFEGMEEPLAAIDIGLSNLRRFIALA